VEATASALKHGLAEEDVLHAWRNVLRTVEQDYAGETRLLAIGPTRDGALLELVVVPADHPARVIHADRLRPKFYELLR
jgi:uncharacterized DUF497 family protein